MRGAHLPMTSHYRYLTRYSVSYYSLFMRSSDEHIKDLEGLSYRELRLLEEVDTSPDLNQRQLARRLGVALGVANLLLRRGARQGYIRITQLGWRRWAYFVTPKGMSRKLHLTLAYIERFLSHYQRVRRLLSEDISNLPLNKESCVAIVGTSELAELAFLALRDIGVEDIEVFERSPRKPQFLGIRVQELGAIVPDSYAKVVVADSGDSSNLLNELYTAGVSESQVVELLHPRRG